MLKTVVTFMLAICTMYANATIVIRGKVREVEQGAGQTSIRCKGNEGECVRIENGTRIAEVVDGGTVVGRYAFESYKTEKITIEGEESTGVILLGSKKL